MNNDEYVLSNLNMISRIALLEKAPESRDAIDSLIAIIRYKDNKESMSTLTKELEIVGKMFKLFRRKKRDSFNGIILVKDIPDTCYIRKGSILDLIQIALSKQIRNDQYQLEVKIVTKVFDNYIELVIQDNGIIDPHYEDKELLDIYDAIIDKGNDSEVRVVTRHGIGTKVIMTIPTN